MKQTENMKKIHRHDQGNEKARLVSHDKSEGSDKIHSNHSLPNLPIEFRQYSP